MKHRTLRLVAYSLTVLAWIFLGCGVIASIIIAIKAATPMTQIVFLIGGFLITALNGVLLLAGSKLIYLFLSIDEHLEHLSEYFTNSGDQ